MAKVKLSDWLNNCGGWSAKKDLAVLKAGLRQGFLDEQDEYGMTGLSVAVMSGWKEGVATLLKAGANTELRYHRTGETALCMAIPEKKTDLIAMLLKAKANPDAANHWGLTPRAKTEFFGSSELFAKYKPREINRPPRRIQNAEHLADHHHPRFKIPDRDERESLQPGIAVILYVYGPKSETKQDTIKVRITKRTGKGKKTHYVANVETPLEECHLAAGTTEVEFGPEHIATVFIKKQAKKPLKPKVK